MTILIVAVESPALSSTCRTAGLVSALQTRLIAASRSGQYASSFVVGVASLGIAGVGGGNVLSSCLISSLVRDGGAGDWAGASGFVTGGLARASSAFLKASARSREDWGFGDNDSAGA